MELGRVSFKERDVADLLTLYDVTDEEERQVFFALVRQANAPGWWHKYGDVLPSWFETYLGLEQAASVIRAYEPVLVPGLLQTEDYARAVARLADGVSEAQVEQRVSLRLQRQQILHRPDPVHLWVVIDETALRRPIGGRAAMLGQVDHLIRMSRLGNVTVQVMPFSAGGHAAAGGQVTMLRFAEELLPDVVYFEQMHSALYMNKPAETDHHWNVLNRVVTEALPPDESERKLRRLADLI